MYYLFVCVFIYLKLDPDVHMYTHMCIQTHTHIYNILLVMYMQINPIYMAYLNSDNFGGHWLLYKIHTRYPVPWGLVCVWERAAWQHCEWPAKFHNFTTSVLLIVFAILASVTFWSMACGICWFCFLLPRSVWLVGFLMFPSCVCRHPDMYT